MHFDPENRVIKLCVEGIEAEGFGQHETARQLYQLAWEVSSTDFEKFTAAHYLARNREDAQSELHWNLVALQHALAIEKESMRSYYPSLYLNIARSYESLGDISSAHQYYQQAAGYIPFLSGDGYGKMIESGITAALKRIACVKKEE